MVFGCVLLFVAVNLWIYWRKRGRKIRPDWRIVFSLCAIGATLLPFLVFTEHASETYLYPGAAFLALLLAITGERFLRERSLLVSAGVLAVMLGSATFARNERVAACGRTAARILSALPVASLRQGAKTLVFAEDPDEPFPPRYGIYSYSGISTIDPGSADSMTSALRMVTQNTLLAGVVVSPDRMAAVCSENPLCFEVHSNGAVEPFHAPVRHQ